MSIYKSYKHGASVKTLVNENGVRTTFNSLKRNLGGSVRIKHNRIQIKSSNGTWAYRS